MSLADVHVRVAAMHRQSEARQRATERMHTEFWRQLQLWIAQGDADQLRRPAFMGAVATTAGWQGAVLSLCDNTGCESLLAASDDRARQAHELELTQGEGPWWDALGDRASFARGAEVERRWPHYGAAVAGLGVHAAAGVPLELGADRWRGSLIVVGATEPAASGNVGLGVLAEALTRTVLCDPQLVRSDDELPSLQVFEDEDFQPVLHQAAGVLRARWDWKIDDAVAMLRAHAFAADRPVAQVAAEVIRGSCLES